VRGAQREGGSSCALSRNPSKRPGTQASPCLMRITRTRSVSATTEGYDGRIVASTKTAMLISTRKSPSSGSTKRKYLS
jgi:hypothetical protein